MTSMSYDHQTSNCFSAAIGFNGLNQDVFEKFLEETRPALEKLRQQYADKSLPFLQLPERTDDLDVLYSVAARYRDRFKHVVVLGTGGSSLGGQAICRLADTGIRPCSEVAKLHFYDNVDPYSISYMLSSLPLKQTGFLVISIWYDG